MLRASGMTALALVLSLHATAGAQTPKYSLGAFGKYTPDGMLIQQVNPGSPLDRVGLRPGDVIVKMDGQFIAGQEVVLRPGVRGYAKPDVIVVDEAARLKEETFAAVRPMLATHPSGRLILMSTPWVKAGTFHRTWSATGGGWERIRVKTEDCPRLTPEYLAQERAELPAWVYEREYLGEFADDGVESEGLARHASVTTSYGGCTLRRKIALVRGRYVIVVDRIRADAEHEYVWQGRSTCPPGAEG